MGGDWGERGGGGGGLGLLGGSVVGGGEEGLGLGDVSPEAYARSSSLGEGMGSSVGGWLGWSVVASAIS